jgi:hypothetical protein
MLDVTAQYFAQKVEKQQKYCGGYHLQNVDLLIGMKAHVNIRF